MSQTFEEILEARAPEYSGDSRVPVLKELADNFIHKNIPEGSVYNTAQVYQVLHWLTLSDRNTGSFDNANHAGPIKKIKTADEIIEYATSVSTGASPLQYISDMKKELGQTPWGIELYALTSRYFVRARNRFV